MSRPTLWSRMPYLDTTPSLRSALTANPSSFASRRHPVLSSEGSDREEEREKGNPETPLAIGGEHVYSGVTGGAISAETHSPAARRAITANVSGDALLIGCGITTN